MKRNFIFFFSFIFILSFSNAKASSSMEKNQDNISISLLTCAPGSAIYTLFGHTAIRVYIPKKNVDRVYNYGLFNFNTPNFIFRFTLGKTDYKLGVTSFLSFISEYQYYNRQVWEQTLNLKRQEKEKLISLLEENYKPSNRTYRYNFLYNNCATKPREIITESINGTIIYTDSINESFRSLIHKHTNKHDWSKFGIDLCLGSPADQKISLVESLFSPLCLMKSFEKATIIDTQKKQRPLITNNKVIYQPKELKVTQPFYFTPFLIFSFLFTAICFIFFRSLRNKKTYWIIDFFLLLSYGVAGCALGLLSFFSTHPAVCPNYLLILFNPLHLLLLPFIIKKIKKKRRSHYVFIYCILLTFFIVLSLAIPQRFNLAVLPLILCLLIRCINHIILTKTTKQ